MAVANRLGFTAQWTITATGSTVTAWLDVGAFSGKNVAGIIKWNTSSGSITIQAANSTGSTAPTDLFTLTQATKTRKQSTVAGTYQYVRAESTNIKTTAGAVVNLAIVPGGT